MNIYRGSFPKIKNFRLCPACGSDKAYETNEPFLTTIQEPAQINDRWNPELEGQKIWILGVLRTVCLDCGEESMTAGAESDFSMDYELWQVWRVTGQVPAKVEKLDKAHGFSTRYIHDQKHFRKADQKLIMGNNK